MDWDVIAGIALTWGAFAFGIGMLVGRAVALSDEHAERRQQERDFADDIQQQTPQARVVTSVYDQQLEDADFQLWDLEQRRAES